MSAGVPGMASKLTSRSLATKSGLFSTALSSRFMRVTTSGLTLLWATKPNQAEVVMLAHPLSLTVGTSGS